MQTRTHLTTPPGQEPMGGAVSREDHEVFLPGLELPSEPRPPGRFRTLWITLASIAALVLFVIAGFEYATRGQDFDPALDSSFETDLPQDPGEPAPGLDTGDGATTEPSPAGPSPSVGTELPGEG